MLDNWTVSNTQIVAVLAEYPVAMSVMSHSDVWPTLIMNDFLIETFVRVRYSAIFR